MKTNLYMNEKDAELFKEKWCTSHHKNEPLKTNSIENAIVLPPLSSINRFNLPDAEVGVLDENQNYIPNSGMMDMEILPYSIPENIEYIDKEVVWGGFIYFHYGHFLLQSTTRLYYYLKNRDKIPYIAFSVSSKNLPQYVIDFFDLLNFPKENIILVDKFTRFKKVICPEVSSYYYRDWTQDFVLPFQEFFQ